MDVLVKALGALWQVIAVGLLLGAGLPALFALGIRSLNSGRTVLVSGDSGGAAVRAAVSKPSPAGMAGAVVCFSIVVLAVLFGIVVIIFGKQLFGT
jgi:hypothetical protein